MDKIIFDEAQKIWTEIAHHKTPGELQLEVELYKKMLNIFQVGDYYYMIFNPPEMVIEHVGAGIENILGWNSSEFTLEKLFQIIHPEDMPYFMDFEAEVTRFFTSLPPDKVMKYKSRYDYRLRKKNGDYIRILQQIVTIQTDETGAVLRTFVVHTDISHLKKENRMVLSFIGMEGEPSYIDIKPLEKFIRSQEILSSREKEILNWLARDKTSHEIGDILHISKNTVDTHRRNMLRKTHCNSIIALLKLALDKGWI